VYRERSVLAQLVLCPRRQDRAEGSGGGPRTSAHHDGAACAGERRSGSPDPRAGANQGHSPDARAAGRRGVPWVEGLAPGSHYDLAMT